MAENDVRSNRTPRMPDPQELAQLSPEDVAQAMEEALDGMTEDTYDQAVLDAYLDALDAQTPMPDMPDVDASYQQFQSMLTGALPSRHKRRGRVLRMTLRVFLAAAFLFGCLVAAQASGMNIFGAVTSWTEDTFRVDLPTTPPTTPSTSPWYQEFLDELATIDLTAQDLPTWLPEGYQVPPQFPISAGIAPFDSAFFNIMGPNMDIKMTLTILTHLDMDQMEYMSIDKNDTPVKTYEVNDKTVYFFHDDQEAKAVCQYGDVFYLLEGDVTEDMIEPFFGSIGQASGSQ